MSALSTLLTEALPDPSYGGRWIQREAEKVGLSIGHATASSYLSGRHPQTPSEDVLNAFSAVLKIDMGDLREAAKLPREVTATDLPPEVSRLTPKQWEAVRAVILSMVDPGATSVESKPTLRVARKTGRPPGAK